MAQRMRVATIVALFFIVVFWKLSAWPGLREFVIEIGEIDLGVDDEHVFLLSDLPTEEMVIGLAIPVPDRATRTGELKSGPIGSITLAMSLVDKSGHEVFSHEGTLRREWVWSRGAGSPDGGVFVWGLGTHFTPGWFESYELRLSVSPFSETPAVEARVIATGGGWK